MDSSYEPYVHAVLFRQATGIDVTKLSNWGDFIILKQHKKKKEIWKESL